MTFATFILSSGRCGTQWLAKHLGESYADRAVVTHEPLLADYLPRQMLGLKDPEQGASGARLLEHAARIEQTLQLRDYIECGWPCYAAIPYFATRFKDRIRVVHLPRHPIWSASSMVSHHYYVDPPRKDRLTEKALLTPFDEGVRFPEYRERWEALDAFERCLYFWAELHAFGLAIESELGCPWLRLKSEDMFSREGVGRLLRFLELPARPAMQAAPGKRFDRYSFKTLVKWNVEVVKEHPRVIDVSERLGYDALEIDPGKVRQRYSLRSTGATAAGQGDSAPLRGKVAAASPRREPPEDGAERLRQEIPIIGATAEEIRMLHGESKRKLTENRDALSELHSYCLFVGYPRSGHSLVGAMLDAHPNMVVSHELDVVKFLGEGFDREQIAWLMIENARRTAAAGRGWGSYGYAVPGQWQGRFDRLHVLGDKKGGATSLAVSQNPLLLDHITGTFENRVKFIHVVRNPFDVIATMMAKMSYTLPQSANHFFRLCQTNLFIRSRVGKANFMTVWHEDLLADPPGMLARLCTWLGEEAGPGYLEACAAIVDPTPKQSRRNQTWPQQAIGAIGEQAGRVDFLARYVKTM